MESSTPGGRFRSFGPPDPPVPTTRGSTRGGTFAPFIPSLVGERRFGLAPETAAACERAGLALAELQGVAPRLTSLGALAQVFLRAEALASSRLAGVRVSHERLARATR